MTDDPLAARAIAFYLPQYHPIPENDEWWGPGFTEWTNVTRAKRLFPSHKQPHLPADLGFYDLRLPEAREAQAALAAEYGIAAFCYWHYWFGAGSQILERPFAEVLASGSPSLPFCLGWANESWSGVWHGAPGRILREQTYLGAEDDQRHFDAILPAFRDERYFRVNDKPVFYVYRPHLLPDAPAFVERWQVMARAAGLEGLYLVAEVTDSFGRWMPYTSAIEDGFDAGVHMRHPADVHGVRGFSMRVMRKLRQLEVYPYSTRDELWDQVRAHPQWQPAVLPNWDSTPRSHRRGFVLTGATPERFATNVAAAVETLQDRPEQERLLWVKSWNEWAEGNYLEPDQEYGRQWLEALREGLTRRGR
ncbi:glycoside hydrolase family 99-like domain-containing protein [Microbacterium kribbense]|uniref:Glycoside hydrolase family 99-like domain-containing protein n=1 Tax=Microbacterium kribbense TaxID=433645 RepID=A0ABP7G006_9MICO